MSCLRRRPCSPSPAVKTPLEVDDLLSEILLRLPPQPSSLPRASFVCKRWRSLASDPGFFRRFRRHHRRNPPLLGFFNRDNRVISFMPTLEAPNRVPPGRFSLQRGKDERFMSLGCRHGLVLIFDIMAKRMLVWEPVTGNQHRLAIPPGIATHAKYTLVNGAVLRPAGEVDHFQVVLTVADNDDKQHRRAVACVYSSETGLWGDLISTPLPSVPTDRHNTLVYTGNPAVLSGGSLYWVLAGNISGILEFDLEKQSLGLIGVPVHMLKECNYEFWIMRAECGGLGLLFLAGSILQLWKRKTDCDGVASWGLGKTIELGKLIPLNLQKVIILGFAENNNVVFLWTGGVLFMIHLETLQCKKLFETKYLPRYHPFESFYTAGNRMPSHIGYSKIKLIFVQLLTEYSSHPFVLTVLSSVISLVSFVA